MHDLTLNASDVDDGSYVKKDGCENSGKSDDGGALVEVVIMQMMMGMVMAFH